MEFNDDQDETKSNGLSQIRQLVGYCFEVISSNEFYNVDTVYIVSIGEEMAM